jgi:pyridoxamine 5'-phosphate oxidase family protein
MLHDSWLTKYRGKKVAIIEPEIGPCLSRSARRSANSCRRQEKVRTQVNRFTPAEIAYLQGQRLGRLATIDAKGDLHVVPVGFRYNPEHDTIDIGGYDFVTSKKYRDALRYGRVAFVVDDVLPPWKPRFVEVRGTAQAESTGGAQIVPNFAQEMLRITPTYIVSFGVNDEGAIPGQGRVQFHGRKVE